MLKPGSSNFRLRDHLERPKVDHLEHRITWSTKKVDHLERQRMRPLGFDFGTRGWGHGVGLRGTSMVDRIRAPTFRV